MSYAVIMLDNPGTLEISMAELVLAIAQAIRNRSAFPKMPTELTLDEAYQLQRQLVESVSDGPVAGLKAGMTAPAGQKSFGLTHPLIGSLYSWGRLSPGTHLRFEEGVNLECEIGLVIDSEGNPQSAGPVIEVPRMEWSDPDDAKGANLTACNIASDRYIVGEQRPMREDYSQLTVRLTRDDEEVLNAPLSDALGGPHNALAWMLNEAKRRGLEIVDGMLLITGACGGIHPAKSGAYVADYGELGSISFSVS